MPEAFRSKTAAMCRMIPMLAVSLVLLSAEARGAIVDTVVTNSPVYRAFSGSIDSASVGTAATLQFDSPIYNGGKSGHKLIAIDFTNNAGIVQDVLYNVALGLYYDHLHFDGAASGNSAIGTVCVASGSVACLAVTGTPQELSSTIATLNDGLGIFGGSTITVTIADAIAVPEPVSLTLLAMGLTGVGLARRCSRKTA